MSGQINTPNRNDHLSNEAPDSASSVPMPSNDELVLSYRVGAQSRALEEHIVRLVSRGEVKFAIWGPGEEVHGTATALALHQVVNPDAFGFVPHYRSGSLCSMWCHLRDRGFLTSSSSPTVFKKTDPFSEGRQMVYHLHMSDTNILPVQSGVGMQLGKAAGYARGFQHRGITDGVAMAVIGDGSTAEGDMHDAMNAASVWNLPVIYLVTDNEIAISTTPEDGRGIRDFEQYAKAFGLAFFDCDGRDFWDVYETTVRCATYVKNNQKPALIHAHHLPRFNGHSSAADVTFDLTQDDPLIAFGQDLVSRELVGADDILKRIKGEGRDFFAHHDLGAIMSEEDEKVRGWLEQVGTEPDPDPADLDSHIYPPFPDAPESTPGEGTTQISYAGAIRSALDKLIERQNGVLLGQDVGWLGGVMQASAGLKKKHPESVTDSPLNRLSSWARPQDLRCTKN